MMYVSPALELCLPQKIVTKLRIYEDVTEIRIRRNCRLALTVGYGNLITDCFITSDDMDSCITRLCKNSVYAYFDCIKKGYIPFDNGYRIGVCGRAVTEKDCIINISEINGLNIRLPRELPVFPNGFLNNLPYTKGFLVYSAPNVGKTTLLKMAASVSAAPPHNKKTAVIDCRDELYSKRIHEGLPIDFYSGYPKYEAMDMAIKTMSPEIIICDEIGLIDSPLPFIECKNCGVSLICSAHAESIEELLSRKNIRSLYEAKVFEGYAGISVKNGKRIYTYTAGKDIAL